MPEFSPDELARYGRHLVIPEFGGEGQARLRESSVLLVGLGGLGSPAALYLAAAGVGRLVLADDDRVERSNLQRQVLFTEDDLGRPKAEVAAERLAALNPLVRLEPRRERFTAANGLALAHDVDLVLDGSDNFATRYLVNDACVLAGRPLVQASVLRLRGQASVFHHRGGPCYRCLFPEPPVPGTVPDCATAGVLGVLPGLLGSIQALEAIKVLANIGETLGGRLLLVEGLALEVRTIALARDRNCPVCGIHPAITELREIDRTCDLPEEPPMARHALTARDLHARLAGDAPPALLDVREDFERAVGHIGGVHIPMNEVPGRLAELDKTRQTVVYCKSGVRSDHVARFLRDQGFTSVLNLTGGLLAWRRDVDGMIDVA